MTALVTGLSDSKYFSDSYSLTVGVNDCPFPVDHLIVCDNPSVFPISRKQTIINHKAKMFTQLNSWRQLRSAQLIRFTTQRSSVTQLYKKDLYCHSICSPYIAVVHAFYMGATEIHLAGVDITGHPNLGKDFMIEKIQKDFKALHLELKKNGCELKLLKFNPDCALLGIIPVC